MSINQVLDELSPLMIISLGLASPSGKVSTEKDV